MTITGLVTRNSGNVYEVENPQGEIVLCRVKGSFKIKGIRTTNPIAVGDRVEYTPPQQGEQGYITKILPRSNYLIRKSINLSKEAHILASNLDNVFLVVTLREPETPLEFIDRILVTCQLYRVPVTIVLNKVDISPLEEREAFRELYNTIGYSVIECSTITTEGINTIKEQMRGKISLFSGNSGVGKSSIIKSIIPELDIRVAEVSSSHKTGRHTTTYSQMFKIEGDGYLVDTPGVKSFGLIDVQKQELSRYFPEMFAISSDCQFANCTHTHEPKCAVKQAVELGEIPISRYESYISMLESENEKYR